MKINGALKPHQGASCCSKGSSPGAEQLRKYRDKKQQRQQQYPFIITTITKATTATATTTIIYNNNKNKEQQQQQRVEKNNNKHHDVTIDGRSNKTSNANEDIAPEDVEADADYVNNIYINENDVDDDDDNNSGVNNQENNQLKQHQQQQEKPQPLSHYPGSSHKGNIPTGQQKGPLDVQQNNNYKTTKSLNELIELTTSGTEDSCYKSDGSNVAKDEKEFLILKQKEGKLEKDKENIQSQRQKINITTRQENNKNNKNKNSYRNKPRTPKDKGQQPAEATKESKERKIKIIHSNSKLTPTTLLTTFSWKVYAPESVSNQLRQFPTIYEIFPFLTSSLIISTIFKHFTHFWISHFFVFFDLLMFPSSSSGLSVVIRNIRNLINNMRVPQTFPMQTILKSRPRPRPSAKSVSHSRVNNATTFSTTRQSLTSTGNGYGSGGGGGGLCWLLVYGAVFGTLLLPPLTAADDGDTFFSPNGIALGETTTAEFDYASRGQKKFGDKCDNTLECGFPGSVCDAKKKSCRCTDDLPITNHIDKCGKGATVNESCFFNEQCESVYLQTECRDGRCVCRFDMAPIWLKDGTVECKGRGDPRTPETYIDPAMIGVLIGMALMFIIICVVLRLFSQARWRENRTIFNTPNPRLMNVSLLRESKLLHGQERRGSRMSVRAPSRQPSMASLRPHSPNPSLGKTGRMTRSKSNTRSSDSRVSDVSNCSRLLEHNTQHHHAHHHNATHPHVAANANAGTGAGGNIAPNSGAHSACVSPLLTTSGSTLTPTTTITYVSENPVAGTACGTNQTPMPPPTAVTIKPNKF